MAASPFSLLRREGVSCLTPLSPNSMIIIIVKNTHCSSFEAYLVLCSFEVYRDRLDKIWFKSHLGSIH